jgi:hypothetical protein
MTLMPRFGNLGKCWSMGWDWQAWELKRQFVSGEYDEVSPYKVLSYSKRRLSYLSGHIALLSSRHGKDSEYATQFQVIYSKWRYEDEFTFDTSYKYQWLLLLKYIKPKREETEIT